MCCHDKLPKAVSVDEAKKYEEQMRKPSLVFINEENKDIVKEIVMGKVLGAQYAAKQSK